MKRRGPSPKSINSQVLTIIADAVHPLDAGEVYRLLPAHVTRAQSADALAGLAKAGRILRSGRKGEFWYWPAARVAPQPLASLPAPPSPVAGPLVASL